MSNWTTPTWPQKFKSTVSHWQATNRGTNSLFNHNRSSPLPSDVIDYLVIGAGMAGTSMAYHLTRPGITDGKKVVVVDAKDLASGATGRNGGHCAPYSFAAYTAFTTPLQEGGAGLTPDEAVEALDLEKRVLEYVAELIEKEKWEVDFWKGEKVEVRSSQVAAEATEKAYHDWIAARAQTRFANIQPEWSWTNDEAEAKRITRIKNAIAFSKGPAGSLHPHKLATAFMRSAMATENADFYSWAPVKKVDKVDGVWEVSIYDRGTIKAKEVILCSNAHTGELLPNSNVDKFFTPFQGQAVNITPPTTYAGAATLKNTYTIESGPYLVFTPHAGLVHGVHHATAIEAGIAEKKDIFWNRDDSYVKPEIKKWLGEYCQKNFAEWGDEGPGEGGVRYWSGIVCGTQDTLPLVGEMPGKDGLWIAAGFHAHGMGRIPLVTKYLAEKVGRGTWNAGLPDSFKITPERLERGVTLAPPFITEEERFGKSWVNTLTGSGQKVQSIVR